MSRVCDPAGGTALPMGQRQAAVLMAVVDDPADSAPYVILTQRAEHLRDHPGQVSFPGGALEIGETVAQAALREAFEEVALPPESVELLGTLPAIRTLSGYALTPLVGWVREKPGGLHPADGEVAQILMAPVAELLDCDHYTRHRMWWKGQARSFWVYQEPRTGQSLRPTVWGATAGILKALADRIDTKQAPA